MPIVTSNAIVLIAEEALTLFVSAALPIDVAFKMKKLLEAYNPVLIQAKTRRLDLFQKFGVADDEGNLNISDENKEEFNIEIRKLVEEEVTLNVEPITTDPNWLPKNLKLSPEQLAVLEPFLKLEESER